MKWNILFTLQGPTATAEVPNKTNPVECENMEIVLATLADQLPCGKISEMISVIGVRIDLAQEE
ncbi:MAG: hypothetical protein CL480_11030 [Acidobacteria bacterium]|nr:hypothetical protein [Acidobacteriota bacterium]|tara:strand:+ start:13886 stop:14077 length:192 start_codon:yes stop_codon:yes gene_type:complete